jgi:hypothetical protein
VVREETFSFKVLVRCEEGLWVAHCLELDLVTEADTREQACEDMADVITAHVRYALENDNMEYLYHPAPQEVWKTYFDCRNSKKGIPVPLSKTPGQDFLGTITPFISTDTCFFEEACHA